MKLVFLIYGFSFFVLAITILIYPKKGSVYPLARRLWLIAIFGILHGTNEWVDLFILIAKPERILYLEAIRMALLPGSFIFLVLFGVRVIVESRKQYSWLRVLPVLLMGGWGLIFGLSENHFLMGDIWARYLICLPGAFLTGYALLLQLPHFEKTRFKVVINNLKLAAGAFFCYGIAAGLVVKEAGFFPASIINYDLFLDHLGIPVQIFRAACSLILAYSMGRVLGIFQWESQRALQDSEMRFQSVARTAPIILFLEDDKGVITYVDGRGLKKIKLAPGELLGKSATEVFGNAPLFEESRSRARSGIENIFQFTLAGVTFEVFYSPIRDEEGEVKGFLGIAVDITERMEDRAELEKYRLEVAKNTRLAELGMISTNMAKELDEPITVARLLFERLLSEQGQATDPETTHKTIKKGFGEISKVASILERFVNYMPASPGKTAAPLDFYQIIKKMIQVFAESSRRVNLALEVKDVDLVPTMSISKRELEQLFFILMQNAIDAADSGKMEKLTISCRTSDDSIKLIFRDTCRGMTPEKLKSIFIPSYLLRPREDGQGLGLAIAERIITAYGGRIEVESREGKGTSVYVTLPAERIF